MQVITSPREIYSTSTSLFLAGKRIGFVPTMGALHEGHFSLIKRSLQETDCTIASIFVNPRQFNNPRDLERYPKPIDEDILRLSELGVHITYTPDVESMYPEEPVSTIHLTKMTATMEGKFRPGHFEGVALVVLKLLNQVRPQRAYFGLKDLQQFLIVGQMVKDFSMPVEIVGCEAIREKSGLAMSSRNTRLTAAGFGIAAKISEGLFKGRDLIMMKKSPEETKSTVLSFYRSVAGLDIEYLEVVDVTDLQPATSSTPISSIAICVAGFVEGVRLIDNVYLRHD